MASATIDIAYDRLTGDVVSAFDEVRLKGGVVPSSKVSANLAAAIRSISAGVTVFGAIVVDFPAGSTCTCSNGSTTYTAGSTGGNWVFTVPVAGTWTVTAVDGVNTASQTVEIATQGQGVMVELSFRLPSDYQAVEYIQGDGKSWIDTGAQIFAAYDNFIIDLGITIVAPRTYDIPWGNSLSQKRFETFMSAAGVMNFRSNFDAGGGNLTFTASNHGGVYTEFICSRSGTTHTMTGWGQTATKTLSNTGGTAATLLLMSDIAAKGYHRMHYARVTHNDVLVRDMIPCYRKSDSVPGMWDVVGKTFYTNAGTGSFTVGGNVSV